MSITVKKKSGKEFIWVPPISRQELIQKANSFLTKYNPTGNIPVDIERIVEEDLDLRIIPIPNLWPELGIRSYTNHALKIIYIDEYEFDNMFAARVTIAHEVAHIVLHYNIFEKKNFSSPKEYVDFQNMLGKDGKGFAMLERQATIFAPYVLLPQKQFKAFVKKTIDSYGGLECMVPEHFVQLVESIKKEFQVSKGCIKPQIDNEYPQVTKAIELLS